MKRVLNGADFTKAREKLGMTKVDIATIMQLPNPATTGANTVRRWENGKVTVPGPSRVLMEALLCGFIPQTIALGAKALPKRFWDNVAKIENGCWIWEGSQFTENGYGRFWLNRRYQMAHRVAYEALIGEIEGDLVCDHLCRNRACVNPGHIEIVTAIENTKRGNHAKAIPTHCRKGHELSEDNVIKGKKTRQCRKCVNVNRSRRRAEKRTT